MADARIEVPRSNDGHYHLTLDVNGTPVDFMVDTGASGVVLSQNEPGEFSGLPVEVYVIQGIALAGS